MRAPSVLFEFRPLTKEGFAITECHDVIPNNQKNLLSLFNAFSIVKEDDF